jgi:transcriptional regulator with XRE-family HTH domain
MNIGHAIRFCRQQRGMTQPQLAALAKLSPSYLSVLEQGKRDPALSSLDRIARALGMPLSVLMFVGSDPSEIDGLPPELHEKLAAAAMKLLAVRRDDEKSSPV